MLVRGLYRAIRVPAPFFFHRRRALALDAGLGQLAAVQECALAFTEPGGGGFATQPANGFASVYPFATERFAELKPL